ncbi:hypothetical protein [Gluconobacter wancherniae]|uniref:hypothetical protein n=1 Tax=Gluconobacter wancherniae TaxID=1307955 RepID=UPI001B8BA5F4|nr:hypothetical protein [Gluconobacter wancherniae]MBS1093712.1 hypothetical protein [Gluconobacter wancherniae]
MSVSSAKPLSSRNWFSKALAGSVFGLGLTFAIAGIIGLLIHSDAMPMSASGQLLMWLIPTLWIAILGACFMFRSGLRAWAVLGALNIVLWGVFFTMRATFS